MSSGKVASKKKKTAKSNDGNKNSVSSHPPVNDMINGAIASLKEKNGSSLQAIKKYIAANYEVNIQKLSPYINKSLNKGVDDGTLIRTKGKGANGSFKINLTKSSESKKPNETKAAKTQITPKKVTTSTKSKTKATEKPAKKGTPAKETKKANSQRQKPTKETVKAKKTPKRKRAKAKTVRLWLSKEDAKRVPKKDWYRVFVLKQKL